MSQYDASHTNRGPTWRLLLELLPVAGAADDHQPVEQVTNAIWSLGLQPAEAERIEKALLETLQKFAQGEGQDQARPLVAIRLWYSGPSTADTRPSSDTGRVGEQKPGAWGFFLLERREDEPETTDGRSHRIIELYLYQESSLARKTRSEANPKMERKEK